MQVLSPLDDILDLQRGVISRRQALACPGESDATIRRRLRRREWVTILPGVYLNHTAQPTWHQRAHAAVLYAEPAALAGVSALRAADGPGKRDHDDAAPIHVVVAQHRDVRDQPGLRIERRLEFDRIVQPNLTPARVRIEHAAIDVASAAATELSAAATLSDIVRSRRSTPDRLLAAAQGRKRLRWRRLILGVLADAADGASSVLEMEYLRRVERAHGLPRAQRQVRDQAARGSRLVYRDAELGELCIVIELDGRIGHSTTPERDADFERDLDVAVSERSTIRLGWGQSYVRPCVTAAKLAWIFRRLGWRGAFVRCPRCPEHLEVPPNPAAAHQREDFSSACDEKSSA